MKLSTVFLRAAELVVSRAQEYSCDAILAAAKGRAPGALLFWRSRFTPAEDSPEHYWLRDIDMTPKQKKEWRILGLCFAACVARSEGL